MDVVRSPFAQATLAADREALRRWMEKRAAMAGPVGDAEEGAGISAAAAAAAAAIAAADATAAAAAAGGFGAAAEAAADAAAAAPPPPPLAAAAPKTTRVYTTAVADLMHHGHVALFERCRCFGTQLVVGVHSDAGVISYKRKPVNHEQLRYYMVGSCRYVHVDLGSRRAPEVEEKRCEAMVTTAW